jgi:transcriptional regulator with XRE-family HTH domain
MSKPFSTLRGKMKPEAQRQAAIKTELMLAEMPLQELRQARNLTQEQLAGALAVNQAAVSKLEKRTDMYVSTLRNFVRAMGGDLEIVAKFPDGAVQISQFEDIGAKAKGLLNKASELLKSVDPAALEDALTTHPKVAEAVAIGYPHKSKDHSIYAYVRVKDRVKKTDALKKELIAHIHTLIGPVATPTIIQWADGSPRNSMVLRSILKRTRLGTTKDQKKSAIMANLSE